MTHPLQKHTIAFHHLIFTTSIIYWQAIQGSEEWLCVGCRFTDFRILHISGGMIFQIEQVVIAPWFGCRHSDKLNLYGVLHSPIDFHRIPMGLVHGITFQTRGDRIIHHLPLGNHCCQFLNRDFVFLAKIGQTDRVCFDGFVTRCKRMVVRTVRTPCKQ